MSLYGSFEQKRELGGQEFDFENNLLRLRGFEHKFQQEEFTLFVSGNQTFTSSFNPEVFFELAKTSTEKALNILKGGFCGVLWNEKEQEIDVFTDAFGLFPIYYAHDAYKALFSQSLKELLASGEVEREIDAQALLDYFRFEFFLPSTTLIRGVKQLEGGEYLHISEDHFELKSYFEWNKRHVTNFQGLDEIYSRIDKLLPEKTTKYECSPKSYSSFSGMVTEMDIPCAVSTEVDTSTIGFSEIFASKEIFSWLPELNRKKWPMSFSPAIRSHIHKLGLWNWRGLTGKWKKEKLLQEYWDVEFLYQFEHLKRSNDEVKRYFSFEEYSKNGVFLFLNNKIGYGNPGYQLPLIGRLSLTELYIDIKSIQLPILRFLSQNNSDNLDFPTLSKDLFAYIMSVPDGLKEQGFEDNLAKKYAKKIHMNKISTKIPELTEQDWIKFESGMDTLPYFDKKRVIKQARLNPNDFKGIIILGIWLNENLK